MANTLRFLIAGMFLIASGAGMTATRLGLKGSQFTLNGKPAFLLGMSYYGGLGASEANLARDLDELKRDGFNWIRVWATWSGFDNDVSAVDGEGNPREPYLHRLRHLLTECDRRGMAVDVTLSRGNGENGSPRLPTMEAHRRAVETLVRELKPYRNWYLDLSNEHDVRDARYTSYEDLSKLRESVKRIDPQRLLTASHSGSDMGPEELQKYLFTVTVDFLAPHRPRDPESPGQTEGITRRYLNKMKNLGRVVPILYQEPFRRGYGSWQPQAKDYLTDLNGARAAGAAGWCFHNGDSKENKADIIRRSFDLREKRLFEQLDSEERAAIELIRKGR
jgi:hypothetical protein